MAALITIFNVFCGFENSNQTFKTPSSRSKSRKQADVPRMDLHIGLTVTQSSRSQVSCCSFLLLLRPELILAVLSQWSFALSWLDLLWQVRPRCNQQVWMIFWRFRIFLSGVLNCWLVSRLQGRRAKFGTTGCLYVIPVSSLIVVTIDIEMDCSVSSDENRCKSFACFSSKLCKLIWSLWFPGRGTWKANFAIRIRRNHIKLRYSQINYFDLWVAGSNKQFWCKS